VEGPPAAVTLHLVTEATADLLDRVDEDVFDNPVDPASLRRFLANPMNLEAWVATEVGNSAARALYRATGGREDSERAVVYTYDLGTGGS